MKFIGSGSSHFFEDLRSGVLFAAGNKTLKTYFIKISDNERVGAVCLKTSKTDQYSGSPAFFDYSERTKESCYVPNDVSLRIDEGYLSITRTEPYVGDAILIENDIYLCARMSDEKVIVSLSDGSFVTLNDKIPRSIFTKWSLVRKVGDIETTLLEYPGA